MKIPMVMVSRESKMDEVQAIAAGLLKLQKSSSMQEKRITMP